MIDINCSMKYDNTKLESCEYIQAMSKVYSKPPKIANGKCSGFSNKYNKSLSTICAQCEQLKEFENE